MAIIMDYQTGLVRVDHCFTSDAVKAMAWLIQNKIINPAEYHSAVIDYNIRNGINYRSNDSEDHYPLRFFRNTSENSLNDIWCSGVTAGYSGEGPYGTERILKMMGFDITPEIERRINSNEDNSSHIIISLRK